MRWIDAAGMIGQGIEKIPARVGRLRQFARGRGGRLVLVHEVEGIKLKAVRELRRLELLAVFDVPEAPTIAPVLMGAADLVKSWRQSRGWDHGETGVERARGRPAYGKSLNWRCKRGLI